MDFFIHIGTGKTGTSAIQDFLDNHRFQLIQRFSCLYPNLANPEPSDYFSGHCQNHIELFRSINDNFIDSQLKKLISQAKTRNIQKIVLSYEGLSTYPKFARTLHKTLSSFPDVRVIIIVYLRRQDHWLESAWKQWGVKDKRFRDADHFLFTYRTVGPYHYDPLELIEPWEREFGAKNIIVQPYEKEQLADGIIRDFLTKIGIDHSKIQDYNPERDRYYINVGFNRDLIEIFQINKNFYRNINDHRLFDFFSQYLPDTYKKSPFENYAIYSPQQRREILVRYLPQYEIIAKKYLSRGDGRLFYEPLPDLAGPWEPYPGLTVEKIVPIYLLILYNMEKRFGLHTPDNDMEENFSHNPDLKTALVEFMSGVSEKIISILKGIFGRIPESRNVFIFVKGQNPDYVGIDEFLWKNRHELFRNGFFIPFQETRDHKFTAELSAHILDKTCREKILNEIERSSLPNVLFILDDNGSGLLTLLKESLPGKYTIKTIHYLARQDEVIASMYVHGVKDPGVRLTSELSDFVNDILDHPALDYSLLLSQWSQVSRRENAIVRCHEKEQLPEGLYHDLLHVIGISPDNKIIFPKENHHWAVNRDVVEIMRLCNTYCRDETGFHEFLGRVTGNINPAKGTKEQHLLSPYQRQDILARYDESNARVAGMYLGRSDRRLFSAALPDPAEPWEPYSGLSAENASLIFITLVIRLKKRMGTSDLKHRIVHNMRRVYTKYHE